MTRRNTAAQPALVQGTRKRAGGRAGLLGSSALSGGTLRGLALVTGLAAAVPMLAPSQAAAQEVCGVSATGAEGRKPAPARPRPVPPPQPAALRPSRTAPSRLRSATPATRTASK